MDSYKIPPLYLLKKHQDNGINYDVLKHDNNPYLDLVIFNSKGEAVYRSGSEYEKRPFASGMIVEYHLPEEHSVHLGIVVKGASHLRDDEYRLLNMENKLFHARISDISKPSFPVSYSFCERLEEIYKKKLKELDEGTISFTDFIELL